MQVLQYVLPSSTHAAAAAAEQGAGDFLLQVLDNVLPQQLLLHLQQVFAPAAPFWREHSYGRVGYFSYFFRLVSRLQRLTAKLLAIALSGMQDAAMLFWQLARCLSLCPEACVQFTASSKQQAELHHHAMSPVCPVCAPAGRAPEQQHAPAGSPPAATGAQVLPSSS
jgi:hypothetical protein